MQQHEEKGAQANAQVEHERHQPRMSKVRLIRQKTSQYLHRTHGEQDQRNLIRPRWELQFRFRLLGAGFFLCGHRTDKISCRLIALERLLQPGLFVEVCHLIQFAQLAVLQRPDVADDRPSILG